MLKTSTQEVPAAKRATAPGWRDPRLWIGLALVAVSVVVGARVVGASDDTVPMWAVSGDLAPGDTVDPDDLEVTRVRFTDPGAAQRYFGTADTLPADLHLVRGLAAGELLPREALGRPDAGLTRVSVQVPAGQVPPSVRGGSVVDVWVAPEPGEQGRARLAVSEVVVVEAPTSSTELAGPGADRQLVLGVPDSEADLSRVLAASGAGRLMLVGRG